MDEDYDVIVLGTGLKVDDYIWMNIITIDFVLFRNVFYQEC